MATGPAANLVFLPWVRQGAAAGIATTESRGSVELTATLAINGAPAVSLPVRLFGPADVLGIDPRQIVRMDPQPGSSAFEPNYLVALEFDRPDFPWLFTPAKAGANHKLRPWLALVVVRRQPGVTLRPAGDTPLPSLEIAAPAKPADELPNLAESSLWAHAQATSGEPLATALAEQPELSLSRLLSPRRLEPATDYIAALVPAFELGRQAGLGMPIVKEEMARLDPAWNVATQPKVVLLPLYHHWTFRTGVGGDFESLVRLLKAQPAPAGLGVREVDIGAPGFDLPEGFPEQAALDVGGALQPVDTSHLPPPWPEGAETSFKGELAKMVNAPGNAETIDPTADPLLAPPIYGRWHAARTTVTLGDGDWLDQLNLDPRYRSVAAYGTQVVQEHQEALMAAAWEQAGDLQRANQQLRQLQIGLFVGNSLHSRHFARLSEDALMRICAPVFSRVRLASGGVAPQTMKAQLGSSPLPAEAASPAMRRIARPRGPITRRLVAQGLSRPATSNFIVKLGTGAGAAFVLPPTPDVVTFHLVRQRLPNPAAIRGFQQVNAQTVAERRSQPRFTIVPEGVAVPMPSPIPIKVLDNAAARAFRAAAVAHLSGINAGRMAISILVRPPLKMDDLRSGLLGQIEPQRTVVALARAQFGGIAARAVPREGAPPVEPVMHAPVFRQPMYEALRDLSQELLLPGLDAVPPNSAIGLQTNRRFVEAYLVGLNVEMGHELLWRGYPTDERGTCFDRFWDSRGATLERADIEPIHRWGTRQLGDAGGAPERERFVLLLRSELLRRYPNAVIYATRAKLTNDVRGPSPDPDHEVYPAFRGSLEPDVTFFGFALSVSDMLGTGTGLGTAGRKAGYYVVIQEQPTEPRFGFDKDTPLGAGTHVNAAAGAPIGLPLQGLTWGLNAAHMAGITRQMPVRIAIHASMLVHQGKTWSPP